jgi:broad specificity phosphatase PhoE
MNFITRFINRYSIKRIYFVRHGETILNAKHIRQGSEGGLTEKGKEQARLTGERLRSFPIDVMLVSPFERTRETADIINSYLHKPLEYNDLLKERRNPSEIIGKEAESPEVRKITDLIDKSFHDGNLRYSDEENYEDLKERAKELLDYLSNRPEQNIVCVTHGIFLTMVIAYMQHHDRLTPQDYIKLSFYNQANNAGITVCEFDRWQRKNDDKGWSLIAWNDYSREISSEGVPT